MFNSKQHSVIGLSIFFSMLLLANVSFSASYTDLNKALKANRSEVTELTLSGYDSIPNVIFVFKHLQKLTVRNGLRTIPQNIGQLGVLEELIFVDNFIVEIPPSIKYCRLLKDLRFINCHLDEIPKELFELPLLEKLTLKNNQISRIPCDFTDNYTLKELNLKYNKIKVLDDCIQRFYAMETFYFTGNPFAIIQGDWNDPKAFKKLKTLIMRDCGLNKLPVFMTKNITYLDVSNNKIKEVSDEDVLVLENLSFLSMENNPIHYLNESLFRLHKLKSLQIDKYESIIIQLSEQNNVCISFMIQNLDNRQNDFRPCGKKKGMIAIFLSEPTKRKK